jgi:hypothetical protein
VLPFLPGSVAVALTTVPTGNVAASLQTQVPAGFTITGEFVHVAPDNVIVAPGTPDPVITLSRLLIGLIVGGCEVSVGLYTVVVAGFDTFPAGSVRVAVTIVPSVNGVAIVHTQLPSAATITSAFVQVAGETFTVSPGSPVPVITVSVVFIGSIVGLEPGV